MKNFFRTLFAFALNPFEAGDKKYHYEKSHRVILIVIGVLFNGLAAVVLYMAVGQPIFYNFPVLIFGTIGILGFIIGFLGNERAVATIWGNTDR